jgi:hypothetical protein
MSTAELALLLASFAVSLWLIAIGVLLLLIAKGRPYVAQAKRVAAVFAPPRPVEYGVTNMPAAIEFPDIDGEPIE